MNNNPGDIGQDGWFYEEKTRLEIYSALNTTRTNNYLGKISYRKLANILKRAGWKVQR